MARVDCTFPMTTQVMSNCSQFLSSETKKLVLPGGLTIRHVIFIILTNFSRTFI